ncbi:MAG TPA: DoxX family protein [Casimicrobiaceae bacterium]|nr:DoxX family protein [Casimicrobiaceae bacterium]
METIAAAAPASGIARLYVGLVNLLDRLQPIFALAMRLYVAKVFIVSGWLKLSRWDSTLALFENEYHVPLLSPHVAAVLGTMAELGLPVLLILGIGTRAAALALFVFNIIAVISYPDLSDAGLKDHYLWGALMLVIAVYGPGKLSLDHWIGGR